MDLDVDRHPVDERLMPAGTTVRFVVLVALLVVTSGSMISAVLVDASGGNDYGCMLAAGVDPGQPYAEFDRAFLAFSTAYDTCMARFQPPPPWWVPAAWSGLVLLAAGVLFVGLPAWRGRKGRVVELQIVDRDGEVARALAGLVDIAGLVRAPRFVVDPAAASAGAVVLGSNRRPVVCLHGGLLVRARTAPAVFQAIVLHELGHIRNRDLTITYITVAIWRVFLVAVLLPYAAWYGATLLVWDRGDFWARDAPTVLRGVALAAFMVVLVHLSRAEVLRSRELYADRAARRWGADPVGWAHDTTTRAPGRPARAIGTWIELWRTHPNWDLRRAALSDTSVLFDLHSVPIFLTGVASTLINGQVGSWAPGLHRVWWLDQAAAGAAAVLVAGVVGIGLWRATTHAVLTARRVPSGFRAGLCLGCGMVLGELVLNRIAVGDWLPGRPEFVGLIVLMAMGFAWWSAQCIELWVRAWRGRTLRTPMLLTSAAAGVLLFAVFAWWQSTGTVLAAGMTWDLTVLRDLLVQALGEPAARDAAALSVIATAFPLVSIATDAFALVAPVLWVVPLLAWTVRTDGSTPRWVGDVPWAAGGPDARWWGPPPLRRALLPSLLCGAACWPAVAVLPHYGVTGDVDLLVFCARLLVTLVLAAGLAGTIACAGVRECRLPVTLIATGATTLIGAAAIVGRLSFGGCAGAGWPSCGWGLSEGLPLLLGLVVIPAGVIGPVAAFLAAGVGRIVGGLRGPRQPRLRPVIPPSAPVRALATRRASVAVLVAAALAVTIVAAPPVPAPGNGDHEETIDSGALRMLPRQDAVSASTRRLQVGAWYVFGGKELVDRQLDLMSRLEATWNAAATNGGVIDNSVERPLCAELGRGPEDADRYFPVPDPQLQAQWRDFLTRNAAAGAACVEALDENNGEMLGKSFEDMEQAWLIVPSMLDAMDDMVNASGIPDHP